MLTIYSLWQEGNDKEVKVSRERELTTGTCPGPGFGFLPAKLELKIGLPARILSTTEKSLHLEWKAAIENGSLVMRWLFQGEY